MTSGRAGTRPRRFVDTALNVILVCVGAVLLFHPNGLLGRSIAQWHREREARLIVRESWPRLLEMGRPVLSGTSSVLLVEFADYECRFCQEQHERMEQWKTESDNPSVIFIHFPLRSLHPRAEGAALAALCAEQQGRFLAMHDHLMESDKWVDDGNWVRDAREIAIRDLDRFTQCLINPETRAQLEAEVRLGRHLGVSATPTFVSLEGIHAGMLSGEDLEGLVGSYPSKRWRPTILLLNQQDQLRDARNLVVESYSEKGQASEQRWAVHLRAGSVVA